MPDFIHKSVMLAEVLEAIAPRTGGRFVDGTVGGAGHASAILRASAPSGWLFGCDRDGVAVEVARERLGLEFPGRFQIERASFDEISQWIEPESVDGFLADLGVSSPQLTEAARGFGITSGGPLDMRMDNRQALTARDVINGWSVSELETIFREYGDEPQARRLARAIEKARELQKFNTTDNLAELIERLIPRRGARLHPATRVFQAVRIAVNDELGHVNRGLAEAWKLLRPGGRLVILSFHSLEAQAMKRFGNALVRDYEFDGDVDVPELRRPRRALARWVTKKPAVPGEAELAENPRSRSAQLRVLEKI